MDSCKIQTGLWGEEKELVPKLAGSLSRQFIAPPFTILDARQGYWKERKRAWLALGIESEVGRPDGITASMNVINTEKYGRKALPSTSVFDPVLCEIVYNWFCPEKGFILDPFAGGSVRGIVAEWVGRHYVGIELRKEQVEANQQQAQKIGVSPQWITGNSMNIESLARGQYDLIFSCPPYYDLEIYSDLNGELSALPTYKEFLEGYSEIIRKSTRMLKRNRFACFVVSDIRDENGNYHNFVGHTIEAFQQAGLHYYNEAIFVTPTGSLPVRAGRTFKASRKLGKAHQNVLIFVKGGGFAAAEAAPQERIKYSLIISEQAKTSKADF